MTQRLNESEVRLKRIINALAHIDSENEKKFRQAIRIGALHLGDNRLCDEFKIGRPRLEAWKNGLPGRAPGSKERSAIISELRLLVVRKRVHSWLRHTTYE